MGDRAEEVGLSLLDGVDLLLRRQRTAWRWRTCHRWREAASC
jgi:hypothetical protein